MAQPTDYYVDPAIAANSGTGTIGDPYGDLQYALDTVTRNATDGDRFNIKAGTAELLTVALSLTTYGSPTEGADLTFQGYAIAQGDGGIGEIDCQNNNIYIINDSGLIHVNFIDLKMGNSGSSRIFQFNRNIAFIRCELYGANDEAVRMNTALVALSCYCHDLGVSAFFAKTGLVRGCTFRNDGTRDFNQAIDIRSTGNGLVILDNIFDLDGSSDAIRVHTRGAVVLNNSIYSNGGTGRGITFNSGTAKNLSTLILNNIISGFSGTGGIGIDLSASNAMIAAWGHNAVYNCATAYDTTSGQAMRDYGDNETLTSDPFVDAANADFRPRDVGNVLNGSFVPTQSGLQAIYRYIEHRDKGAIQLQR